MSPAFLDLLTAVNAMFWPNATKDIAKRVRPKSNPQIAVEIVMVAATIVHTHHGTFSNVSFARFATQLIALLIVPPEGY
jgi:hypothetical protein